MANKMRVYELAKKHGMPAKEMVKFLNDEFGLDIKSHMSNVSGENLEIINEYFKEEKEDKNKKDDTANKDLEKGHKNEKKAKKTKYEE